MQIEVSLLQSISPHQNNLSAGDQDNVHELDNKRLKERGVVRIDIANDAVNTADYKKDEDPTTFKSEKTGRGPLSGDWRVSSFLLTNPI